MQCKNTQDNAVYVEDLIKTSLVAGTFIFNCAYSIKFFETKKGFYLSIFKA